MRQWPRSRTKVAVILAVVVALALGIAIRHVYVVPRTDVPLRPADAVVVLGGTPYERFRYGIQLGEQGLAPEVVISNSVGPRDPVMGQICDAPARVRVTCFLPIPWTTRGEAREIRALAALRGWHSIILVTTTAHIKRARYIVGRCFSGQIQISTYPETRSAAQSVYGWLYQTGGWAQALVQSGC